MHLLQLFVKTGKNEGEVQIKGGNSVSYSQSNWRIDNADSLGLLLPVIAMVSVMPVFVNETVSHFY